MGREIPMPPEQDKDRNVSIELSGCLMVALVVVIVFALILVKHG
jgi:hypothetical protein